MTKAERCEVRGSGLHWGTREFRYLWENDEGPGGVVTCEGHDGVVDGSGAYCPPPPGSADVRSDEEEATP